MLILADDPTHQQQLPQLAPGKLSTGTADRAPRLAASTLAMGGGAGGMLPAIGGPVQQSQPPQQRHPHPHPQPQRGGNLDAEVRQLERQLRAKDANAQQLLGALSDPRKQPSPSKQQRAFDPAMLSAARVTGLQPSELAEAARIGLTPEDLEQLIEDLAAKEFHQLEQCVRPLLFHRASEGPCPRRCPRSFKPPSPAC
jgi:hypothetical protein